MELRLEQQGKSPVKVRAVFQAEEQQGQRPQDNSELVGVRTRGRCWETVQQRLRQCQGSPAEALLSGRCGRLRPARA